ncbi:MAG: M24 family metallopeptidase [Candidatus Dormibacteraceae bacterium]
MNQPFDSNQLDGLMEDWGVELVLATTKTNVQYLLGGYRFFFFESMDALGLSRYLPALGYPARRPERAFYVGNTMESWQQENEPLWVPTIRNESRSSIETAELASQAITKLGLAKATIAVEMPFLPADCYARIGELLPHAKLVDAVAMLEELRAVKKPYELALIKEASEGIVGAMTATLGRSEAGMTTREIASILRVEENARGLDFDYCLVTAGPSFNRAPSERQWRQGATLCLDSGGTRLGYIGDMARMAVAGSPTTAMNELLQEVDSVQMAVRHVLKEGVPGGEIHEAARSEVARLPHSAEIEFEAHGVGLVSHEVPHLTGGGSWPYPGTHANRPLRAGMVISIETTLRNREVGFVKLEDTLVVTRNGFEAYGDTARGWNVVER